MKSTFFVLCLFILSQFTALACDCDYKGDFEKVAHQKEFVALVRVSKFISQETMEVEIVEILKGNEKRKTIIVWGDDGKSCLPYLSEFKLGKEYIIAFDFHNGKSKIDLEYEISICGEFWLNIENERFQKIAVSSNDKIVKRRTFKEIKKLFKKH
jgi:hypothetical protein